MSDHGTDPWPEMKDAMIERLKGTPPPPPKPDYRAIYRRRMREQRERTNAR